MAARAPKFDTRDLIKGRYGGDKVVEHETRPETKGAVSIPHLPNGRKSEAVFLNDLH